MTYREPARTTTRRIRIRRVRVAGLLVVVAAIAAALGHQLLASSSPTASAPTDVPRGERRGALGEAVPSTVWPAHGQAAVQTGQSQIQAGPNQHAAPIASVAKVMTAYLVLRDHPLRLGQDGPTITGVVLGQPGRNQVAAGLEAADATVGRIAGDRATPDRGQQTLPPLTAPGSHRSPLPAPVRRP